MVAIQKAPQDTEYQALYDAEMGPYILQQIAFAVVELTLLDAMQLSKGHRSVSDGEKFMNREMAVLWLRGKDAIPWLDVAGIDQERVLDWIRAGCPKPDKELL